MWRSSERKHKDTNPLAVARSGQQNPVCGKERRHVVLCVPCAEFAFHGQKIPFS